ncbi:hypothetical protein [Modestobacter sp. L9-4]|uniref:hypothetical protein n=1 Tax=Modestobacter sp. L9-4 TaxID=2851567 RepID=UPI001F1BB60D|nr:hypothetical protein [Modestobacter sp. L9-4]
MGEVGVVRGQVCPKCGMEDAVRVVPGLPDPGLLRAAERGLVVLCGCVVVDGQPEFRCRACAYE